MSHCKQLMKRRNSLAYLALIVALTAGTAISQVRTQGQKASTPGSTTRQSSPAPGAAAASSTVTGSGTSGQLLKWISAATAGDSIVTESKTGNIGIGTTTPGSKLSVQGMIETTLGGYKFPDGTIQSSAASGKVEHDQTIQGDGTSGFPLGIKVPLTLNGPLTVGGVIRATTPAGNAVEATGGLTEFGTGANGVDANGGQVPGQPGGVGVLAHGGDGSVAGAGVIGEGGNGNPNSGAGGIGVKGDGGNSDSNRGGTGLLGHGGSSGSFDGGTGVLAVGGSSDSGRGGIGLDVTGGSASGRSTVSGAGIFVRPGTAFNGAEEGFAGDFVGNVQIEQGNLSVQGNLSKGGGSFKIDHPLDPANKFLYHSFVESPDMMNIYNGTVTTDANGDALVTLPEYFEALNRDFRYQLTVIGTFAQAIVAEKVKDNNFRIKTNAPNVEVSWQVTGIRHDAYANKNRIPVEVDKPEPERGFFLHPDAFNQPEEKSIFMIQHPELVRQRKEAREQAQKDKLQ